MAGLTVSDTQARLALEPEAIDTTDAEALQNAAGKAHWPAFEALDLPDLLVDAGIWLSPERLERIAAALDARPLPGMRCRDAAAIEAELCRTTGPGAQ